MLLSQLHEGRTQTAVYPVTRAVRKAVEGLVEADQGVYVTFLGRSSVEKGVLIYLSSDHSIPRSYANKLRDIVRDEMQDPELPVTINCFDGQWFSDSNAPLTEDEKE